MLARMPNAPENRRVAALETVAEKVARTIARDHNIKVVLSNIAMFNGETRTLYLPQWSEEKADHRLMMAHRGVLDHEVGHAVHTNFDLVKPAHERWEKEHGKEFVPRLHALWNTFEDLWMEREQARNYKGMAEHFRVKNEYVIEKTGGAKACDPEYVLPKGFDEDHDAEEKKKEPGAATPGAKMGMFGALCQAILRTQRGFVKVEECPTAIQALLVALRPEIEKAWEARNSQTAIEATDEAWAKIKSWVEAPEKSEVVIIEAAIIAGVDPADIDPDAEVIEVPAGAAGTEPNPLGGGTAFIPPHKKNLVPQLVGGTWNELKGEAGVVANAFMNEARIPAYTVHPNARRADDWHIFDVNERKEGRKALPHLERTAGPYAKKLQSFLTGAFAASRMAFVIGGMEEGDDLDESAVPAIALSHRDPAIFTTTVRHIEESAFVCVLVDCSGSMGHSGMMHGGGLHSKSAYAAVTAATLHQALTLCRVPHGVLGYTTIHEYIPDVRSNAILPGGYREWSRASSGLQMYEFVSAPGFHDDGAALPYITGESNNLDGESVLAAAKYAAREGGQYDRVILMVIADGLPAGADDHKIEGAYLKQTVEFVARAGIEVYGLGVGITQWGIFSGYYPDVKAYPGRAPTGSIKIPSGEGLSDNVLRSLTRMLTRGYGMSRRGGR